jgi:transposase
VFHRFQLNREKCFEHYHKRSNVGTTFSMIKAKFRDHVRSKTNAVMVKEVLCKIICHNICCLIHEVHELGIEVTSSVPLGQLKNHGAANGVH